jgi:site-specific recombinase XerD
MWIDEALSSQVSGIDFEQSLITIKGKGKKTRTIPISYEMKRRLWKWLKKRKNNPSHYQNVELF